MSQMITGAELALLNELADISRVLSNAHRIILIEYLIQEEHSVERLSELSGLSIANTSQHLQHLKRANFVQTRREGKHIYYRLGQGPISGLLSALKEYAEYNHTEVQQLVMDTLQQRSTLEAISRQELISRIKENNIILLDVRPEEEYVQGHLPGALNIPLEELEIRLAELSEDQEIIAYCRGPYCVLSMNAVIALRAKGRQARRLIEGFPDWRAAGLEVEI